MKKFQVKSFEDLQMRYVFVLTYAPNFPYQDYLAPDDQWTLERAFDRLRDGIRFAKFVGEPGDAVPVLTGYLDLAEQSFRDGKEATAIKALHDFEDASGIRGAMMRSAKSRSK